MTKRKVKSRGKARSSKAPAIHKFTGKAKPKPEAKVEAKAERDEPDARKAAVHKFAGKRVEVADEAPATAPPAKGPAANAARLAAMAAASAEMNEEPEVEVKSKSGNAPAAPKGGVEWKDFEDDEDAAGGNGASAKSAAAMDSEPVLVAPKAVQTAEVDPGVQVVAKGASKFSAADLEMLRASIKVKGGGSIVEGINLDELKWDGEGLVPVVAQDRRTGAVVLHGHTNRETLESTIRSKQMTYWNRNTGKAVTHGAESGHPQRLVRLAVDCDKDAILAIVDQEGPGCHRDTGTCFTEERGVPVASFLGELDRIVRERSKTPDGGKTSKLLAEPIEALRGFVEQANEVTRIIQGKSKAPLATGTSDLLYNLLVVLRTKGVGIGDVLTEMQAQHLASELKKGKS